MQTTQTKVEYSGITTTTTINNSGIVMSNDEDSGNLRHPTSLAINSNYRLHQRDRVNRFTTTTNNNNTTTASSNSPDSCSSPVDFESTANTTTNTSSSSSITPPPQSLTPSSTKSASYQTSSINKFLSGVGIKQRHISETQKKQQQQQPPPQSTETKRTEEEELLQWKDMPKYLQFNPYVLTGYRPLTTFKGCCFSLFYWHNETVNIFTHAIPIVYILAIVPGLMPWEKGYRFLSFCHVFGSVAPWCGSFIYHLFMNIERGENIYYRLLKLDMLGIWISQSFGALPMVTATTHCFSYKLKWCIIISYCLVALWGLYKALTATSPWQRRLCFAFPFTMRSILTFLRTIELVPGTTSSLTHVYLQDAVSILGGAIGAMRIPEKWFPGLVDYYLNSHNIMHVLVVVAVYSMHQATTSDLEWISTYNCNVSVAANSSVYYQVDSNVEL
ncbi:PAQR4 family protein [Megaselia abdita]